jgi:hypothetical protein
VVGDSGTGDMGALSVLFFLAGLSLGGWVVSSLKLWMEPLRSICDIDLESGCERRRARSLSIRLTKNVFVLVGGCSSSGLAAEVVNAIGSKWSQWLGLPSAEGCEYTEDTERADSRRASGEVGGPSTTYVGNFGRSSIVDNEVRGEEGGGISSRVRLGLDKFMVWSEMKGSRGGGGKETDSFSLNIDGDI